MSSIRERPTALAAPLGMELPEACLAFMEEQPQRYILIRHLCNPQDPAYQWRPAAVDFLEQDIHRGQWKKVHLNAHYMQTTTEAFLASWHESVPGPHRS